MDKLNEKLDRNYETYQTLIKIVQSLHTKPSPETLKAIKGLSEQMEKVTLILEKIVKSLA